MQVPKQALIIPWSDGDRVPVTPTECWMQSEALCRLLRATGVDEAYITGDAADFEKFEMLMQKMPLLVGTPAYDAITAELAALGCPMLSDGENVDMLWQAVTHTLAGKNQEKWRFLQDAGYRRAFCPRSPVDTSLSPNYPQNGVGNIEILPLFAPDDLILPQRGFAVAVAALERVTGTEIATLDDFVAALERRLDVFVAAGCVGALHSTSVSVGFRRPDPYHAGEIFRRALESDGRAVSAADRALFSAQMLRCLGRAYVARNLELFLRPGAGCLCEGIGDCANFKKTDTVSARIVENEFFALLDYMVESQALPRIAYIALAPETPYGILRGVAGRHASTDGKPRMLFGIDGTWATASELVTIARAVRRICGDESFAGVIFESEGFLTAPATQMLSSLS